MNREARLSRVKDGHATSSIDRGNGTLVEAEGIVDDLNFAMKWAEYPGRKSQAVLAEELVFG